MHGNKLPCIMQAKEGWEPRQGKERGTRTIPPCKCKEGVPKGVWRAVFDIPMALNLSKYHAMGMLA